MNSLCSQAPRSVHSLDKRSLSRIPCNSPLLASRLPRQDGTQWLCCRFCEATAQYLSLLPGDFASAEVPFVVSCFARWADRWSDRRVSSLTTPEIQTYMTELACEGRSAAELHRERTILQRFYRWALRRGWTDVDPTATLEAAPEDSLPAPVVWTAAEQARLLEACEVRRAPHPSTGGSEGKGWSRGSSPLRPTFPPPYLHPLVLLALRTGLPLADLVALEWRHWDSARRRIQIPGSEVSTGRDIDVPLDQDAHQELEAIRRMSSRWSAMPWRILGAVGLPFTEGRPDDVAVLQAFSKARRRARIREGDFLSLRLTYIRNCALAGVPLAFAAKACDWDGDWGLLTKLYEESIPPPRRRSE